MYRTLSRVMLFCVLCASMFLVSCDDSGTPTNTPDPTPLVDVTGANLYCSSLALTRTGIQGDIRVIGADEAALSTLPASQFRVWLEPE